METTKKSSKDTLITVPTEKELAKLIKNEHISNSKKETKKRREGKQCIVRELKINTSKLSKADFRHLEMLFVEAKWLRNAILSSEQITEFDTKIKVVNGFNKDREEELKPINFLSSQMKQSVLDQVMQDISSLGAAKKKGRKVGKLKFVSEVNSINLKQFGSTYKIFSDDDRIHIQGFKKKLKVFGMEQLFPQDAVYEFANAKLIKRASGYYIHITCYVMERLVDTNRTILDSVGVDLGIKTTLTTSDGDKFDIKIKESDALKNAQKCHSKKKKGSNNRYKQLKRLRREHERVEFRRKDAAVKIVSFLTKQYAVVYMQDENIKGWHKGLFGRSVQHSALGTIKHRLICAGSVVLSRNAPTTKECFVCESHEQLTLLARVFKCSECGYEEDRDIKAAKTIQLFGKAGKYLKVKSTFGTKETGESQKLVGEEVSRVEESLSQTSETCVPC